MRTLVQDPWRKRPGFCTVQVLGSRVGIDGFVWYCMRACGLCVIQCTVGRLELFSCWGVSVRSAKY